MSTVVREASALLARLRGEPGARKVEGALGDARASVATMAEVASHFHRLGMPPDLVDQTLRPLPVTPVPADAELCWEAGRMRKVTAEAGSSLGDRLCLALAKRDELPAWTADGTWTEVADAAEVRVVPIR
jgi:PIN domain nuclease of toxin-antitoxin system